jgi:hypothetical protein
LCVGSWTVEPTGAACLRNPLCGLIFLENRPIVGRQCVTRETIWRLILHARQSSGGKRKGACRCSWGEKGQEKWQLIKLQRHHGSSSCLGPFVMEIWGKVKPRVQNENRGLSFGRQQTSCRNLFRGIRNARGDALLLFTP